MQQDLFGPQPPKLMYENNKSQLFILFCCLYLNSVHLSKSVMVSTCAAAAVPINGFVQLLRKLFLVSTLVTSHAQSLCCFSCEEEEVIPKCVNLFCSAVFLHIHN